jgi:hypothetical protein
VLTKTNNPTVIVGTGDPGSPGGLPDHDHRATGFGGNTLGRTGFEISARGLWNFDDGGGSSTEKIRIEPDSVSQVALGIQMLSAQSESTVKILNSASLVKFEVDPNGHIGVGTLASSHQAINASIVQTVTGAPNKRGAFIAATITENFGVEAGAQHEGITSFFTLNGTGDFATGGRRHTGIKSSFIFAGTEGAGFPNLAGVESNVTRQQTDGSIGTVSLFRANFDRGSVGIGGTIDVYGFHMTLPTSTGSLTNLRGFYCPALSGAGTNHDFYGAGPQSYFGGKVGINKTIPTAQFDTIISGSTVVGWLLKMATAQSVNAFELRNSADTLLNLIDSSGRLMTLVGGTNSPVFSDSTTLTKRLGFDLSGAAVSTVSIMALASTVARTYTFADDTGTVVSRTASVDLTAQTATIGTTTAYTAPHTGMYRVALYAKTTTSGLALDTVTVTIGWNDGTAQTFTTVTLDLATLNAYLQDSVVLYNGAASNTITYATTVVKTGTPQYMLRIRVEAI